jgi:pilus assembly protein CpaC
VAVAAKYFPDVINNMTVSGAQQGIVHVKVYEISRTKMRNMGFDWASFSSNGTTVWSGVNGLLQSAAVTNPVTGQSNPTMPNQAFRFNTGGLNAFYAVLSAMRQDGLSKLDSEPDLVAISGRPAYVKVGGTLYYQTTSALGVGSPYPIDYGTRLDIVPIMLGNGRIHVDVRAKVDDLDAANSTPTNPAIKGDELETGVELRAGQTLAIAGLIENRVEATNSGLPWISEIPYLGVPFRSVSHQTNEVELLVLLTPEIVDGMEPGQVPTCLPGMNTTNPSDWELFFKGHMEVPNCCPADGAACQANGPGNIPTPACEPVGRQNPQDRNQLAANSQPPEPGFIGPIGYDVLK